jgi:hypothetical protein
MAISIVNCFSRVTTQRAYDIISISKKKANLHSLSSENKLLLGLEDQKLIESLNSEEVEEKFEEINYLLRDLSEDV